MTRNVQLIRLVGACLCLLTSVTFCHMFSAFQVRALVAQAGIPPHRLPGVCLVFAHNSLILLLLPVVLLAMGIYRLFRDVSPSPGVELYAATALLLAFFLLAVCILAWQIPYATAYGQMI